MNSLYLVPILPLVGALLLLTIGARLPGARSPCSEPAWWA